MSLTGLNSRCWHTVLLSRGLRGDSVSSHSGCCQQSVPFAYRTNSPILLLSVNGRLSQIPEATTVLAYGPFLHLQSQLSALLPFLPLFFFWPHLWHVGVSRLEV